MPFEFVRIRIGRRLQGVRKCTGVAVDLRTERMNRRRQGIGGQQYRLAGVPGAEKRRGKSDTVVHMKRKTLTVGGGERLLPCVRQSEKFRA